MVSGTTYRFRVRAANVYGWGDFSSVLSVKAAAKPAQVLSVSTTVDDATGKLKISWLPPSSNGDSITEYKVEIAETLLATYYAESTYCPGTSTTLLQNLYCLVPMTALTALPYSYGVNRVVVVRISAKNSYGFGATSTPNTSGARVRTVPVAPTTPTVGSIASDTQVQITWTALTFGDNTGQVAITAYELYGDNGSGGTFNELSNALTTSYLATGLTGGTPYKFKVRATNMYGPGAFSAELTYTPIDVPSKIGLPTVTATVPTASATTVTIAWTKPDAHSSTITLYDVQFLKSDGTFTSIATCPGTPAASGTAESCVVEMSAIITATGLSRDSYIQVKVRA